MINVWTISTATLWQRPVMTLVPFKNVERILSATLQIIEQSVTALLATLEMHTSDAVCRFILIMHSLLDIYITYLSLYSSTCFSSLAGIRWNVILLLCTKYYMFILIFIKVIVEVCFYNGVSMYLHNIHSSFFIHSLLTFINPLYRRYRTCQ
jgi:hypothetical protein